MIYVVAYTRNVQNALAPAKVAAPGNPYESLRAALTQFGFKTTTAKNYEKQFGISLQAPKLVAITASPSHLMADPSALSDALAPFASQIQSEFEINLEDLDMWLIEPPTPAQAAPVYIAAKATAHNSQKKERILGTCEKIEYTYEGRHTSIGTLPDIIDANFYMDHYENKSNFFGDGSATTVTIVQQPAHGELEILIGFENVGGYSVGIPAVPLDSTNQVFNAKDLIIRYKPEAGYLGDDYFVTQFDQSGVKVKVKQFFIIDSRFDLQDMDCEVAPGKYKKEGSWKISLLPAQTTDDPDSWLRATLTLTTSSPP